MSTKSEVKPEINVTPLIDVLLVLLIIFMVVSPLKPSRFETKVPSEQNQPLKDVSPNPLSLIITINSDSTLQLNSLKDFGTIDEPSALLVKLNETFRKRLANRTFAYGKEFAPDLSESEKIEKTVFVKAPRSIKYGEVVKLIDAVKGTGAEPIGLQIDDLP